MINEYIIFYGYDTGKLADHVDNWIDIHSMKIDEVELIFSYGGYSDVNGYIGKVLNPFSNKNNTIDSTVFELSNGEKQIISAKCVTIMDMIVASLTTDKDMFECEDDYNEAIAVIDKIKSSEPAIRWMSRY